MFELAGLSLSFGLLLGLVCITVYTDLRWGMIYNATTYPGILLALLINGLGSLAERLQWANEEVQRLVGWIGIGPSLLGLAACGGILVLCFIFFRQGAGDVKLMALIGAFLGPSEGVEVLLWTFVIAAAIAVTMLVWRVGAWQLVRGSFLRVAGALRLRSAAPLTSAPGGPLKTMLALAPSSLIALVLVHFNLLGPMRVF